MKKLLKLMILILTSAINASENNTFKAPKNISLYHAFMILYSDINISYGKIKSPIEAAQLYEAMCSSGHCDYVLSRSMRISLQQKDMDKIHTRSYNRDHGKGKVKYLLSNVSEEEITTFNKEIGEKFNCDFFTEEFIKKMPENFFFYFQKKIKECKQK